MPMRQIHAALLALFTAAPLAAQAPAGGGNAVGERQGDRLHAHNARAVDRVTKQRPRLNPSASPRVGPNIHDGYIVLPDTTIMNPAISSLPPQ